MRRIHKISGQIVCQLKKNATKDYFKEFLIRIGERANYRRQTFGYYLYSGGRYSIENSVNKTFLLKFIDSKPAFVDILCHTSTREFGTCNISFYLRDYEIDFSLLKKNLRSRGNDLKEESNGNFCTIFRNDGRLIRLSAYPFSKMITVSSSFYKKGLQPSKFLEWFTELNIIGN